MLRQIFAIVGSAALTIGALILFFGFSPAEKRQQPSAKPFSQGSSTPVADTQPSEKQDSNSGHVDGENPSLKELNDTWKIVRCLIQDDYKTAFDLTHKSALEGNPTAKKMLSIMYCEGWGVSQDFIKACNILNEISEHERPGSTPRETRNSTLEVIGQVVELLKNESDPDIKLWKEKEFEPRMCELKAAAERGSGYAQMSVGCLYNFGVLKGSDVEQGIRWLKKAAEEHHVLSAEFLLGLTYQHGYGVPANVAEAIRWFRTSAKKGHPFSAFSLATLLYQSGRGDPDDFKEALDLYLLGAHAGYMYAEGLVSIMYKMGHGVEKDLNESFRWALKAATHGLTAAEVMVGIKYAWGEGVPVDQGKAFAWMKKAAEKGDPEAEFYLGMFYREGTGVPVNIVESTRLIKKSAMQQAPYAQAALGCLYISGDGVDKDPIAGMGLLVSAAEQNNPTAKRMLQDFNGTPHDAKDSQEVWASLQLSAKARKPEALFLLYWLHTYGSPKIRAPDLGLNYLKLAAKLGHKKSEEICIERKLPLDTGWEP